MNKRGVGGGVLGSEAWPDQLFEKQRLLKLRGSIRTLGGKETSFSPKKYTERNELELVGRG